MRHFSSQPLAGPVRAQCPWADLEPWRVRFWRLSTVLAVLLVYVAALINIQAQEIEPLAEISPAVIEQWESAGAEFGWLMIDERCAGTNLLEFSTTKFSAKCLPAFRLDKDDVEQVGSLPMPNADFGVSIWARIDRKPSVEQLKNILQQLKNMSQLQALDLSASEISNSELTTLTEFDDLTYLDLSSLQSISDDALKELGKLASLKSLSLRFLGLGVIRSDESFLSDLANSTQLEVLDLGYAGITDSGLKQLSNAKRLVALNVQGNDSVTNEGVIAVSFFPGLQHLNLHLNQCGEDGFAALNHLKSLKTLILPSSTEDANLEQLASLGTLERLGLEYSQITDKGLEIVAKFGRLQSLNLAHTKVTDKGLRKLASLGQLQELNLTYVPVTGRGLDQFAGLQSLNFSHTRLKYDGLESVSQLSGLKILDVSNTLMPDAGLALIGKLTNLVQLNLASTKLTGASLAELMTLTSLEELHLDETRVTDASLNDVARLSTLKRIRIFSTDVTDMGLATLESLTELQTIDAGQTNISMQGAEAFQGRHPEVELNWSPKSPY